MKVGTYMRTVDSLKQNAGPVGTFVPEGNSQLQIGPGDPTALVPAGPVDQIRQTLNMAEIDVELRSLRE